MFALLRRRLRQRLATSRYPTVRESLPEGARGLPAFESARCDLNGACAAVCPTGAIAVSTRLTLDLGACVACGRCAEVCAPGALTIAREPAAPERSRAALVIPLTVQVAPDPRAAALAARARAVLGRSLHVRHLDAGSCNGCDWEINATTNAVHDLQRFGIDFVASPRHADVLLVTGTMTRNLELAARRTYDAMGDPRLVVAVGACAVSGAPYPAGYASGGGAASALPVDIFVPGCPPRPQAIIDGLLLAMGRLEEQAAG